MHTHAHTPLSRSCQIDLLLRARVSGSRNACPPKCANGPSHAFVLSAASVVPRTHPRTPQGVLVCRGRPGASVPREFVFVPNCNNVVKSDSTCRLPQLNSHVAHAGQHGPSSTGTAVASSRHPFAKEQWHRLRRSAPCAAERSRDQQPRPRRQKSGVRAGPRAGTRRVCPWLRATATGTNQRHTAVLHPTAANLPPS